MGSDIQVDLEENARRSVTIGSIHVTMGSAGGSRSCPIEDDLPPSCQRRKGEAGVLGNAGGTPVPGTEPAPPGGVVGRRAGAGRGVTAPIWVRLVVTWLVPREFGPDTLADLEHGLQRRRALGKPVWSWLGGELVRMPYIALWRQARRRRAATSRRIRAPSGWCCSEVAESLVLAARLLVYCL